MRELLRDLKARRPRGAGRTALNMFRDASAAARVHATIRWWSAPFPAIEAALPPTGRVLEIGCGHGLFSVYASLTGHAARTVQGVDIDAAKIAEAERVTRELPGVAFEVASSGAVATGPWDAIVIIDMLYLLPAAEQRALLTAAVAELAPTGALLVKEMSPTPRWKARWNVFQETMSVSILGITERAAADAHRPRFDFVPPSELAGWLQELGLRSTFSRLDRHRVHPHQLLVARRVQ